VKPGKNIIAEDERTTVDEVAPRRGTSQWDEERTIEDKHLASAKGSAVTGISADNGDAESSREFATESDEETTMEGRARRAQGASVSAQPKGSFARIENSTVSDGPSAAKLTAEPQAPAVAGPTRARLIVIGGSDRGRAYSIFNPEVRIGRAVDNDLVLTDIAVSRHHVCLHATPAGITFRDLGSGNGTLVNNQPAEQGLLHDGDQLELGNTLIRFEIVAGPAKPRLSTFVDDEMSTVSRGMPQPDSRPEMPLSALVDRALEEPAEPEPADPGPDLAAVADDAAPLRASGPGIGESASRLRSNAPTMPPQLSFSGPATGFRNLTSDPPNLALSANGGLLLPARTGANTRRNLVIAASAVSGLALFVILAAALSTGEPADGAEPLGARARAAPAASELAVPAADRNGLPGTPGTTNAVGARSEDDSEPQSANPADRPPGAGAADRAADKDDSESGSPSAATRAPGAAAPPGREPRVAPPRPGPKPARPQPVEDSSAPPRPGRAAIAAARRDATSLYAARDFAGASAALRTLADSVGEPDARELRRRADQIEAVDEQITAARASRADPVEALNAYEKALRLDQSVADGALNSAITAEMARVAPRAAAAFMARQRYEQAKDACDLAERYDASDDMVARVRSALERKAEAFYAAGLEARSERPADARALWTRVTRIVPKRSPWYAKAARALQAGK
jgi:pSer/pThr/pTyr-binding forkhead associated (FHA) protein